MPGSALTAGPSSCGMVETILLNITFGRPAVSTPTTAREPAALAWTKCASIGKLLPPIMCSLGRWKWNCRSL